MQWTIDKEVAAWGSSQLCLLLEPEHEKKSLLCSLRAFSIKLLGYYKFLTPIQGLNSSLSKLCEGRFLFMAKSCFDVKLIAESLWGLAAVLFIKSLLQGQAASKTSFRRAFGLSQNCHEPLKKNLELYTAL